MLMWEKLLRQEMYGDDDPAEYGAGTRKGQGRNVARGLGISPTAVHNLLAFSSAQPRIDTMKRMAEYWMVPLPFLLVESSTDDAVNELICRAFTAPPECKQQIVRLLQPGAVQPSAGCAPVLPEHSSCCAENR